MTESQLSCHLFKDLITLYLSTFVSFSALKKLAIISFIYFVSIFTVSFPDRRSGRSYGCLACLYILSAQYTVGSSYMFVEWMHSQHQVSKCVAEQRSNHQTPAQSLFLKYLLNIILKVIWGQHGGRIGNWGNEADVPLVRIPQRLAIPAEVEGRAAGHWSNFETQHWAGGLWELACS